MPTPPLTHGKESVDRLVGCARLGVPMIYASALARRDRARLRRRLRRAGQDAEMLSGLVIAQLTRAGAPFVYGVSQGWMEPRTRHIVYCGPEEMAARQASATCRGTTACPGSGAAGARRAAAGRQWAFETGMTLLTAVQSDVTLLARHRYVASGTASSYETMVVADELVGCGQAYLGGVTIDEESLAVAEIAGVRARRDPSRSKVLRRLPRHLSGRA